MNLIHLRQQIDAIDRSVLQLLARRMSLARALVPFKKAVTDKEREEELHHFWNEEAQRLSLDPAFAEEILQRVLAESKRIQLERNSKKSRKSKNGAPRVP